MLTYADDSSILLRIPLIGGAALANALLLSLILMFPTAVAGVFKLALVSILGATSAPANFLLGSTFVSRHAPPPIMATVNSLMDLVGYTMTFVMLYHSDTHTHRGTRAGGGGGGGGGGVNAGIGGLLGQGGSGGGSGQGVGGGDGHGSGRSGSSSSDTLEAILGATVAAGLVCTLAVVLLYALEHLAERKSRRFCALPLDVGSTLKSQEE
jgi:hypothetical protein